MIKISRNVCRFFLGWLEYVCVDFGLEYVSVDFGLEYVSVDFGNSRPFFF